MYQSLIAVLAGVLMVCSFAPLEWWFVAPLALTVLFYFWCSTTPLKAALTGFSFGFGVYITGVSWVYISLKTYGGMPTAMAVAAVVLLAAILASYIALAGYIQARITSNKLQRLTIIPFVWVIFEWVKGVLFTGFPWLDIGYTQTTVLLSEYAAIGGVYLVSFVLASCAAVLVVVITEKTHRLKAVAFGLLLLVIAYSASFIHWSKPQGRAVNIAVVQGNVPITEKWGSYYQGRVINKYVGLSSQVPADLLVWPETALPLAIQQINKQLKQSIVPSNGAALLTGLVDQPDGGGIYNAAALYCGNGNSQIYRKKHLVPFGEYLPLRSMLNWLLEYLHIPMSDFSSWQGEQALACNDDLKIALSICYEDAFAAEMRDGLGDAGIMVNISEDAWFGDSLAAHQRLEIARMRAMELARPMVRSANTGPSGFIDADGKVVKVTEQFKPQSISHLVQPMYGDTLFKKFGNWIVWLSMLVLALIVLRQARNRSLS